MGMGAGMGQMGAVPTGQEDVNAPSISAQDWGAETYGGGTQGQIAPIGSTPQSDISQANTILADQETESSKSGGRMQKVGDGWVFVRDGTKA